MTSFSTNVDEVGAVGGVLTGIAQTFVNLNLTQNSHEASVRAVAREPAKVY